MDFITHGLVGALVAQAGFAQRIGRPAMIALVAGAMLPDVDVVMAWVDELSVVRYHRGLTHSFVGAFLLALPLAAAMHDRARERFRTAVQAQGLTVLRTQAYPRFPGLWTWLGLAETPTAIIQRGVDLGRSARMRLDHYSKPGQDKLFIKAGELEEVQAFFGLARFPWMIARQQGEHTILEYYDLRFGAAPHHNDFRLEVVLDGGGAVKHIRLNHRF
jgi:hypothetical protein